MFSIFDVGWSAHVSVRVCIRTHTHTLHVGYLKVGPGFGTRHLESLKNPNGLNLRIHIYVNVYQVHVHIKLVGD